MEAMKLLLTAVCSVTVCGSVFAAPPPPPHYYRNDGVALAAPGDIALCFVSAALAAKILPRIGGGGL